MDSNMWYGRNGNSVRCPVPGCHHIGTVITKVHCRLEHDMEREEVGKLYGPPENFRVHQKWGW